MSICLRGIFFSFCCLLAFSAKPSPSAPPVFGKVVAGMDVVKTIEGVQTGPGDKPVEPVVGTHQTFEHQLPPGTCQATHSLDPERWSAWCDRSCGPDKWGTVALGGCTTGSETAVGCKCKAGVKALRVEGDAPSAAAVAPVVPAVAPVAPVPQAGECLATNPTLTGASQSGWDAWCAHTCQAPTGRPELCATPALTGNAMCKCGPVL